MYQIYSKSMGMNGSTLWEMLREKYNEDVFFRQFFEATKNNLLIPNFIRRISGSANSINEQIGFRWIILHFLRE